jgi:HTH-type transcriptional regulator, sugar sensing transcriptional regulator
MLKGTVLPLQEHETRLLQDLGLTSPQARVYLALANLGNAATASQISTTSNVARQDVYRMLTELQALSLIERIIAKQATFKAIPVQEAVDILIERQKHKTRILREKATETFKVLAEAKKEDAPVHQDNPKIVLVPKKELLIRRIKKAIETSQECVCAITPWHEFVQFQFMMHEQWKQALNSGVKIRWITHQPPSTSSYLESNVSFVKHPSFTLRIKANNPDVRFSIHDNREVFFAISSATNAAESPALWTSNPIFLFFLKDYFELSWSLATDCKSELV